MANLEIRPLVWADVQAGAEWYEAAREGLGREFVGEVQRVLRVIEGNPRQCPCIVKSRRIHRARLHRFPYGVYYQRQRTTVVVFAVKHLKQAARAWRQQLE